MPSAPKGSNLKDALLKAVLGDPPSRMMFRKTSRPSKAGPGARRIYDECTLTPLATTGKRRGERKHMGANAQLTRRHNFALLKIKSLCFFESPQAAPASA
jgi:hypothetical protein